jgi:hypothetical protein
MSELRHLPITSLDTITNGSNVNLARSAIEAVTIDAMKLVQRSLGLSAFLSPPDKAQ